MHRAETGEVGVAQRRGLRVVDPQLASQSVGGQSVGQAVAHGLDVAALLGGDVSDVDPVHHRGYVTVQVLPRAEGVDQRLVAGQMRHDAHLDLGVVRRQQALLPLAHREGLADPHPLLGTSRDVLQVGIGGGQPPRGSHGLLEGGVDASVGKHRLAQALHGLTQLDGVAVLQQMLQERVPGLGVQGGQCLGVSGVAPLGPASLGHLQLVEDDRLELLGAGEVELVAGGGESGLGGVRDPGVQLHLACRQHRVVHGDTGVLHLRQAGRHGHLELGVERDRPALGHLLAKDLLERQQAGRAARRGQQGPRRRSVGQ